MKHKKKIIIFTIIIAIFGFLVFVGAQELPVQYDEYKVVTGDVLLEVSGVGTLNVIDTSVHAKNNGVVRELYISNGAEVNKGEKIVWLEYINGQNEIIVAPAAGEVTWLRINEYENYLQKGQLLFNIIETEIEEENLEVKITVDEYNIGYLNVGDSVEVYINALKETVPGTIEEILDTVNVENSVSYYPVRVSLPKKLNYRVGLGVEVSKVKKAAIDALIIPMSYVNFDEFGDPYINFYETEKEVAVKKISVGISDGDYVEVLEGLKLNDIILRESAIFTLKSSDFENN